MWLRVFFFNSRDSQSLSDAIVHCETLGSWQQNSPLLKEEYILHHNEQWCSIEHSLGNTAVKVKDYSIVGLMLVTFII